MDFVEYLFATICAHLSQSRIFCIIISQRSELFVYIPHKADFYRHFSHKAAAILTSNGTKLSPTLYRFEIWNNHHSPNKLSTLTSKKARNFVLLTLKWYKTVYLNLYWYKDGELEPPSWNDFIRYKNYIPLRGYISSTIRLFSCRNKSL